MKKIKVKAYAKINLTLDILGLTDGYHDIQSLVASVDVCDKIILKKRKDKKVTLKCVGIPVDCDVNENNAVKAAKLFIQKFSTMGVDIKINKKIPVGGGLGGSSADIAGVLNGMKALYKENHRLLPLANALGSDSGYMLSGGYAVLSGRGDEISKKNIDKTLYLIIVTEEKSVSARASYLEYDRLAKTYSPCTKEAERALKRGDFERLRKLIKNDLYSATSSLVDNVKSNISALERAGAPVALMTGSGSAVYGLFENKKDRDKSYKKLYPLYGKQLIKAQTII